MPWPGSAPASGRSSRPIQPDVMPSFRYFSRHWPFVQRQDTRFWIWEWWFESTRANRIGSPNPSYALALRPRRDPSQPGGSS